MIGIDIASISRIEKMITKFGDRAKKKFMTPREIKERKKISSIAGIWAGKEAFSKALGVGIGKEISFKDIEIVKNSLGKPSIQILNPVLEKKLEGKKFDISITHDNGVAIAVVIIIEKKG